jgi:hypothetical protein
MQVVNALIEADKPFDLLVIPGAGHSSGGDYQANRRAASAQDNEPFPLADTLDQL